MRLPWPFRRSEPDGGASAATADGAVQRLAAHVRHDWRTAGMLRPSFVGDPGIRLQRFPDEIAGRQPPPPILAPLGHARSLDGPTGLVSGLARPTLVPAVLGVSGRADLPLRPGRSATRAQRASVAETAPPVESTVAPPASRTPAGVEPIDMVDPLPVIEPRRAGITAIAAPPRTASLTVARTPDLTLAPTRARVGDTQVVHRALVDGTAPPSVAVPVPGTVAGVPTRTILRTSSGSRVRLGAPIQRSERTASTPALELAHPGPRATGAAPAIPVQRHVGASAQGQTPVRVPVGDHPGDAPLTGGLSMTIQDEPMGSSAAPPEMRPLIPGGLVLARAVATPEPTEQSTVARADTPASSTAPSSETASASPAPMVGTTPLTAMATLRPTIPASDGAQATALPSPSTSVALTSPDGRRRVQRSASPRLVTGGAGGGTATLPGRARTPSAGPAAPLPALRSVLAVPPVSGPAGIPGSTARGTPAATLVLARAAASTVAVANDQPPSTAMRTSSGGATPVTLLRDATDVTTSEEAAAARSSAPGGSGSQGAGGMTGGTVAGPMAGVGVGAGGAASAIPDRDLDEMVRRLYPRLRRSLSSELLVARERAGTLADLR